MGFSGRPHRPSSLYLFVFSNDAALIARAYTVKSLDVDFITISNAFDGSLITQLGIGMLVYKNRFS